jgi:hypothetical protein
MWMQEQSQTPRPNALLRMRWALSTATTTIQDTEYTHTTTHAEQTRYGKYYQQRHRRSRAATPVAAAALCQLFLPKGPSPSCAPSTSKVAILGVPDTNGFFITTAYPGLILSIFFSRFPQTGNCHKPPAELKPAKHAKHLQCDPFVSDLQSTLLLVVLSIMNLERSRPGASFKLLAVNGHAVGFVSPQCLTPCPATLTKN